MRTGSLVYRPGARLQEPSPLPEIGDQPKAAWSNGWWTGIAVGIGIAIGACATFVAMHMWAALCAR